MLQAGGGDCSGDFLAPQQRASSGRGERQFNFFTKQKWEQVLLLVFYGLGLIEFVMGLWIHWSGIVQLELSGDATGAENYEGWTNLNGSYLKKTEQNL